MSNEMLSDAIWQGKFVEKYNVLIREMLELSKMFDKMFDAVLSSDDNLIESHEIRRIGECSMNFRKLMRAFFFDDTDENRRHEFQYVCELIDEHIGNSAK